MTDPVIAHLFQWIWLPLSGLIGWFVRRLDKRLDVLRDDAARAENKTDALKFEVARHYVTRREHLDAIHRVDGKLDRILDKFDQKRDK
tara:strand:- start:3183 stop:3446 length:264 start_codon:yes stop_codon:yes gene_type:complete